MVSEVSFYSDNSITFSTYADELQEKGELYGSSRVWTRGDGWRTESIRRTAHVFHLKKPRQVGEVGSWLIPNDKSSEETFQQGRKFEVISFDKPMLAGHFWSKLWKKHKTVIIVVAVVVTGIIVITVVACAGGTALAASQAATPLLAPGGAALGIDSSDKENSKGKNSASVTANKTSEGTVETASLPVTKGILPLPRPTEPLGQIVYLEHGMQVGNQYFSYQSLQQSGNINAALSCSQEEPSSSLVAVTTPVSNPSEADSNATLIQPKVAPDRSFVGKFFETMGSEMIEPELLDPKPIPSYDKHSKNFSTPGFRCPSCCIGGINGMDTSLDEATDHAAYISRLADNRSIDWTYNCSRGRIADVAEIFTMNYAGYSPNTAKLLQETFTKFHEANKDNPKAKYLQFCHSQGAIHLRNALEGLPQEIRDRVVVVAIAPAAVITTDLCFTAFNYASKKDIVPKGELIHSAIVDKLLPFSSTDHLAEAKDRQLATLILLDPHPDATGIDHDFQSPTFEQIITKRVADYINCNGEYE